MNDAAAVDETQAAMPADPAKEARRMLDELRAQRTIAELGTPEDEIADAKRELADEQALQKAIKEHGKVGMRIHGIYTPLGIVIVKRPSRAAYREYQTSDDRFEAQDVLVHACLVHPDHAGYERILDEYPAIQGQLAGAIALLAGHHLATTATK